MKINRDFNSHSKFDKRTVRAARNYWRSLTMKDLFFFWRHYTVGQGKFSYASVKETTSFFDYIVLSASESDYEKTHDI